MSLCVSNVQYFFYWARITENKRRTTNCKEIRSVFGPFCTNSVKIRPQICPATLFLFGPFWDMRPYNIGQLTTLVLLRGLFGKIFITDDQSPPSIIYTVPKIQLLYSQKWNCEALLPIRTFMYLWAIYIFPGSACVFGCSKIGRPILRIYKLLTEKYMNVEIRRQNVIILFWK